MGADEATLVEDPYGGDADGAVVVRVLEAAVRKRGPFDLMICGFASDDGYSLPDRRRALPSGSGCLWSPMPARSGIEGDSLFADRDLEDEPAEREHVPCPRS